MSHVNKTYDSGYPEKGTIYDDIIMGKDKVEPILVVLPSKADQFKTKVVAVVDRYPQLWKKCVCIPLLLCWMIIASILLIYILATRPQVADMGPIEVMGPRGPAGLDGATGHWGATGLTGPGGFPGQAGSRGDRGFPGSRGPKGFPGVMGATGPTGPRGNAEPEDWD